MKAVNLMFKKLLCRMLLWMIIGKADDHRLDAMRENAKRTGTNWVTYRAAIYRDVKATYGKHLTVNETNLVTDAIMVLDDLDNPK